MDSKEITTVLFWIVCLQKCWICQKKIIHNYFWNGNKYSASYWLVTYTTVSTAALTWREKLKDRFTTLLILHANGTEELNADYIGRTKEPCFFNKISGKQPEHRLKSIKSVWIYWQLILECLKKWSTPGITSRQKKCSFNERFSTHWNKTFCLYWSIGWFHLRRPVKHLRWNLVTFAWFQLQRSNIAKTRWGRHWTSSTETFHLFIRPR